MLRRVAIPGFFFGVDICYANPAGAKLGAPKALTVLLSQLSPMGFVAVVAVLLPVALQRFDRGAVVIHSVVLTVPVFPYVGRIRLSPIVGVGANALKVD